MFRGQANTGKRRYINSCKHQFRAKMVKKNVIKAYNGGYDTKCHNIDPT
jgi:hypothetical protein